MIAVAVLLLPVLGLLLYGMDRIEDWLRGRPPVGRHAGGRHLRLVPSTKSSADRGLAGHAPQHRDAA